MVAIREVIHFFYGGGFFLSSVGGTETGALGGGLAVGFGRGRYNGPFKPHAGSKAASINKAIDLRMRVFAAEAVVSAPKNIAQHLAGGPYATR